VVEQVNLGDHFLGKPDRIMTKQEEKLLVEHRLIEISKEATKLPYYKELNPIRRGSILKIIYYLGFKRFENFKKTNQALTVHNYGIASKYILDSHWFDKEPNKVLNISEEIRTGV
jgi:hypothetical protein